MISASEIGRSCSSSLVVGVRIVISSFWFFFMPYQYNDPRLGTDDLHIKTKMFDQNGAMTMIQACHKNNHPSGYS